MSWAGTIDPGRYHVTPLNDLVEHEMTDECVCVPRSEPVETESGSINWVIVHHSLDGRELTESG